MEVNRAKIAEAWREAALDLGIEVAIPFAIALDDDDECEFIALTKHFGTAKGTLMCLPEEWDDLGYANLAEEHGYYCSGLYPAYEQYERDHFVETLRDWDWFGAEQDRPNWLKG